jgi:hypothetical protein
VCDSNVYDAIAADADLKELIRRCHAAGKIAFLTTRVQDAELSEIPADKNIGQAAAVDAARIGRGVFVAGYSRAGEDRLADAPLVAKFQALMRGAHRQAFQRCNDRRYCNH